MRKYDRQEDSLWKAAFDGNVSKVKTLVRKFEPSKNREFIRDVLLCAVQQGHAPVVKVLLAAGANVEQVVCDSSMLQYAAWQGHLNVVRVLVAAGAVVDRKVEGRTAFEAALETNHVEVADYLKKEGADWVMLTLLYACRRGDLTAVKKAIAAGARVDRSYGAFKETPLIRAAGNGRIEVVKFLLKHGADPRAHVQGRTALWHAAATGRSGEVIDALFEAGGDVNDPCDGCTPLMAAATFAPLPVVRRLVELGADIAAIDGTGVDGVLDYARKGKKPDVIAYLSKFGTKSARGPARDVAHAIAREFGGRPKPVFDGFFIDSSLSGFRCQFRISRPRCSVEISNLKVTDKNFRLGESAWLIIGSKPERGRGPCREATKARQITGAPVYRSTDLGSIPDDAVLRFCKQHRRAVERLRLSEADELWIGDTYVQLTWTQSGELRPWDRLKALGALVREIAPPQRKLFTREWLLKPAAKSAGRAAHQLGGKLEEPLCCPHCRAATNLMAQIDLADPLLPKTALGARRVPVFWCLDCVEWDATFFDISARVPRPLDQTGKQIRPTELETGDGDLPERRVTLVPVAAGKEAGRKSKLGGQPKWIQMDQTPDCPKCERPMAFVLQLAGDSRVSYGDEGMLYAFACPDCRITASLVQSH